MGARWASIIDAGFGRMPLSICASATTAHRRRAAMAARRRHGRAFARLSPDVIVLLGDRYEILAPLPPRSIACIPVLHLHGGEVTEGAVDDAIRHAVTKLSHLHCVATDDARTRVAPARRRSGSRVPRGRPGVDAVRRLSLLSREALEASLGFPLLSATCSSPSSGDAGSGGLARATRRAAGFARRAPRHAPDLHAAERRRRAIAPSPSASKPSWQCIRTRDASRRSGSCVISLASRSRRCGRRQFVERPARSAQPGRRDHRHWRPPGRPTARE